jgi:hypothetical protein
MACAMKKYPDILKIYFFCCSFAFASLSLAQSHRPSAPIISSVGSSVAGSGFLQLNSINNSSSISNPVSQLNILNTSNPGSPVQLMLRQQVQAPILQRQPVQSSSQTTLIGQPSSRVAKYSKKGASLKFIKLSPFGYDDQNTDAFSEVGGRADLFVVNGPFR